MRDWIRGKFTLPEGALSALLSEFSLQRPESIEILDDYWYGLKGASNGGKRRVALYGPPGTPAGRKKGGIISQRKQQNRGKYTNSGWKIRKEFHIYGTPEQFAELAGIILGDGGITNDQIKISLSSLVDRPYALYVTNLIYTVFHEKPRMIEYTACHTIVLLLSGRGVVELLQQYEFKKGNKVRQQVSVPLWIEKDLVLEIACVRGLMDTDGGLYFHRHQSGGFSYENLGMCFSNRSLPIVRSVLKVLQLVGIKAYLCNQGERIYIYSISEIKKYFAIIGSNNPKNHAKYTYYISLLSHRI